ncbi:MAG: outer membrane beta-barrel protein, partial [Bacteroidales bacterium]|nr:outer membrane beta-barrel protein [Bacteroidales bacterium]
DEEFDPKSIAWGVQAGVGIDVMKRFTLDVNYSFGLSKMFDALDNTAIGGYFNTDNVNIDNTRQNLFMVTVGIKLF